MEDLRPQIELLISEGKEFTYANFATKGQYGYPAAYTPKWISWRTRTQNVVRKVLARGSAGIEMLEAAEAQRIIGNGDDKFHAAESYYSGALDAALAVFDKDTFGEMRREETTAPGNLSNEVFVVHGHDAKLKNELEIFLAEIGLEPVVLHRQPDEGQTIIEKFEKHSDVGFALVLLTPDEVAYLATQEGMPDAERAKENRARPNVIFEFGYFVGKLGRRRVCCLYTGDVVVPSDLQGLLYKPFARSVSEVSFDIMKELQAVGYQLTLRAGTQP